MSTQQSPLVRAYFALVDASGMSDEEFSAHCEAESAKLIDNSDCDECGAAYGADHDASCSLHPANIVDPTSGLCDLP